MFSIELSFGVDFQMQITSRTDYECIEMVIAHAHVNDGTLLVCVRCGRYQSNRNYEASKLITIKNR